MKKNMGRADKIIRLIIAAALLIVFANGIVEGSWAVVLIVLAGILVLTSFVSFCPLYAPFHIHTNHNKRAKTS